MKLRSYLALAALAFPAGAVAQDGFRTLVPCEQLELGLESVAVGEDLSGVRTFYQGQVTLFLIDRVEPACCAYGVAVVMPAPPSEGSLEGMRCWAIFGYAGVDLRGARASYQPREGLTVSIPIRDYVPETGGTSPGAPVRLRIDAGRGTIVDLSPPRRR